jgi:hypothetical protein
MLICADGDTADEPELVEADLLSLETLDRASPELWPEQSMLSKKFIISKFENNLMICP